MTANAFPNLREPRRLASLRGGDTATDWRVVTRQEKSAGTLYEPAHDPGVTAPADQTIRVVPSEGYNPLIQEIGTMKYPGLPAARTVEQAILLAQLQILRQMQKTRS